MKTLRQRATELALTTLLSKHGKRVMFITSLYRRLLWSDELGEHETEAIGRLNALMQLTPNQASLQFPIRVGDTVWKDRPVDKIATKSLLSSPMTEEQVGEIAQVVVSMAPEWVTYSYQDMLCDTTKLICHRSQLTHLNLTV